MWSKAGAGMKAAAKHISKTARDVRDIKSKAQKCVLRCRAKGLGSKTGRARRRSVY